MNAVLSWSIQSIVVTAAMIPVVKLLSRLFRHRPAIQHALWVVVLLKFVTPSIVAWPWQLSDLPGGVPSHMLEQTAALSSTNPPPSSLSTASTTKAPGRLVGLEQSRVSQSFAFGISGVGAMQAMAGTLMSVWLVGALVFAARQYRLLNQQAVLVRRGIVAPPTLSDAVREVALQFGLRPIPLLVVPGISSPFVWCLGQLKLAWPEHMLHGETVVFTRSIIAHELAHVCRRDHWVVWLELIAATIWWWNPLVWLVRRNLRASAEMACDSLALTAYPEDRCAYAELLLALSTVSKKGSPALVLCVGSSTPRHFERRMSMIVSDLVSGKLSAGGILLAGLLALVSVPTWSFGQANEGGQSTARSAGRAKQPDSPQSGSEIKAADKRNFAVYPIKTTLQRKQMGWSTEDQANARAYVAINGMAVVDDAGVIDEKALDLDALRKALAPYADHQNGVVFINVKYNSFPARNHNAEQLVVWGLEGFGRDTGFKSARAYVTYFNDRRFDWAKEIALVNEKVAGRADDDEEPIGDDLVKVYAVRTAFSAFLTGADCIVEVLAVPNDDGKSLLTQTVHQAIVKYVGEAKLWDKKRVVFGVRLTTLKEPSQRDRLFGELDALAKSLGFSASSVATR